MLALLHISNGGVRQLQLTDFFIAQLFVSDGVIAVMIQPQTKRTTGYQQDNNHHTQNTVHIPLTP
ncbi:hypothetical protein KN836_005319, partial [Escherichia coli]|nr:hypothetical protein [Escherichia coli]EIG9095767.1 hypothetical protein [Escherichia coli]HAP3102779.1 hypothetical protein [Escherichia coli]HAP3107762.1 hypothetical protein [Escherichia coli]HAP3118534.1 hypothetical protein [Escherichia coli]